MDSLSSMFDTHSYYKSLVDAGVPQEQADAHTNSITKIIEFNLASKNDVIDVKFGLKKEIQDCRLKLQKEIEEIRLKLEEVKRDVLELRKDLETNVIELKKDLETNVLELRKDLKILDKDLTIKTGIMISLSTGILATLIKLL